MDIHRCRHGESNEIFHQRFSNIGLTIQHSSTVDHRQHQREILTETSINPIKIEKTRLTSSFDESISGDIESEVPSESDWCLTDRELNSEERDVITWLIKFTFPLSRRSMKTSLDADRFWRLARRWSINSSSVCTEIEGNRISVMVFNWSRIERRRSIDDPEGNRTSKWDSIEELINNRSFLFTTTTKKTWTID